MRWTPVHGWDVGIKIFYDVAGRVRGEGKIRWLRKF
jgi:hypothetical protein